MAGLTTGLNLKTVQLDAILSFMPQPFKGVRVQHTLRLPADLHRAVVGAARERHWDTNTFITRVLSEAIVDHVPNPVGVRPNQKIYDDNGTVITQ